MLLTASFGAFRRLLGAIVLASALTGATLAGWGVVVTPHPHSPGTPVRHGHDPVLYRLPLPTERPPVAGAPGAAPKMELAFDSAATVVLALLAFPSTSLARLSTRFSARFVRDFLSPSQWRALVLSAPPRAWATRSV